MFCPKCGANVPDGSAVCPACGAPMGAGGPAPGPMPGPNPNMQQPYAPVQVNIYDHTAEMDPKDISENKVVAMLPYVASVIGVIVCALISKESKFVNFHMHQALKLIVCELLILLCTGILFWTCIVPIAAAVCEGILFVLTIIGIFRVGQGKAIELPIVRGLGFLK